MFKKNELALKLSVITLIFFFVKLIQPWLFIPDFSAGMTYAFGCVLANQYIDRKYL